MILASSSTNGQPVENEGRSGILRGWGCMRSVIRKYYDIRYSSNTLFSNHFNTSCVCLHHGVLFDTRDYSRCISSTRTPPTNSGVILFSAIHPHLIFYPPHVETPCVARVWRLTTVRHEEATPLCPRHIIRAFEYFVRLDLLWVRMDRTLPT